MGEWVLRAYVEVRSRVVRDERGEGVISTAIAVLVMAALGVLMWTLFQVTLNNTQSNVNEQIGGISG
jgi:hypothetical protein